MVDNEILLDVSRCENEITNGNIKYLGKIISCSSCFSNGSIHLLDLFLSSYGSDETYQGPLIFRTHYDCLPIRSKVITCFGRAT